MKNINTKFNTLVSVLPLLAILVLGLSVSPTLTHAQAYDSGFRYRTTLAPYIPPANPIPTVESLNPSSTGTGYGTKTITILGGGFVPGSIARFNGVNRTTTFIDGSHLFIKLNSTDLVKDGTYYITVWNPAPEGGYSNAGTLKVGTGIDPANSSNTSSGNTSSNSGSSMFGNMFGSDNNSDQGDTFQESNSNTQSNNTNSTNKSIYTMNTENDSVSKLASNTIFGSTDGFMPSGIIQWILLAIIILIIVIITRKVFGGEDHYHSTQLKHK